MAGVVIPAIAAVLTLLLLLLRATAKASALVTFVVAVVGTHSERIPSVLLVLTCLFDTPMLCLQNGNLSNRLVNRVHVHYQALLPPIGDPIGGDMPSSS
jgi:hypothetical protein